MSSPPGNQANLDPEYGKPVLPQDPPASNPNVPSEKMGRAAPVGRSFLSSHRYLVILAFLIIMYYVAMALIFGNLEGWNTLECIYFATVVVSTVGYGDYLPKKDASKVAVIVMLQFALIIVAVAMDYVLKKLQSMAAKLAKMTDDNLGIFQDQRALVRKRQWRRFVVSIMLYILTIIIGTLVFATAIDWSKTDATHNKWLMGLYLTMITITTVGFGDYSPAGHDSDLLMWFGCGLMIFGIPITLVAHGNLTNWLFKHFDLGDDDKTELRMAHAEKFNEAKFEELKAWVSKMRTKGIGNYWSQGEGKVSRLEYLCFILVKNRLLKIENIHQVMENFGDIDVTSTGFIAKEDCDRSSQYHLTVPGTAEV